MVEDDGRLLNGNTDIALTVIDHQNNPQMSAVTLQYIMNKVDRFSTFLCHDAPPTDNSLIRNIGKFFWQTLRFSF